MKTKEELKEIKAEVEALDKKLEELTDEELKEVTGGGECYAFVWGKSGNEFNNLGE